MDYSSYNEKALIELLNKCEKLTFESKSLLYSEFKKRNLLDNTKDVSRLKNLIDLEKSKITNLEYLKDFGFKLKKDDVDHLEIVRPKKVTNIDSILGLVGLTLILFSILGLIYYYVNFENFYLINKVAVLVFSILILRFGIIILSNAINRIFKYSNFIYRVFDSKILITRLINNKTVEIEKDISSLRIYEDQNRISLFIDDIEFLSLKEPNFINRITIKAIYNKTLLRRNGTE